MHGMHGVLLAAGVATQPAPQPRLVKAAHEFEAQMMKELMQPLSSGGALFGEDDEEGAGSAGALGSFASEALAQALSEQGGFGIANKIIGELSQHGSVSHWQKMVRKPQKNASLGGTE